MKTYFRFENPKSSFDAILKKIIIDTARSIKVKYNKGGVTFIDRYDLQHAVDPVVRQGAFWYTPTSDSDNQRELALSGVALWYPDGDMDHIITLKRFNNHDETSLRRIEFTSGLLFPFVAAGETESDEPETHTVVFPPPETDEEWLHRIESRITLLSRCFADGLPAQYARLATLTQKIHSSGIGETHRYGNRYDSAANAGQHAIGFLRWQFEKLRDGVTEDLFKTKAELEEDLNTLESTIKDETWVKDFYLKHNSARWSSRSTRGIIHLPGDDFDFGTKIHDTFRPTGDDQSFTRNGPSEEVEEAARKSEAELALIAEKFGDSLHSHRSELITSREVTPEVTVQPTHNANLASLVVSVDTGPLTLSAPFNSGDPDGFDPDRTEYNVLLPVGKDTVGIVGTAAHSGATVVGNGDVTITDRSVVTEKEVVVTSEDGLVTKTYTISIVAAQP